MPFFPWLSPHKNTKKLKFLICFTFSAAPCNILKVFFSRHYCSKICIHFSLPYQNRTGNIEASIFKTE